MRTKLFCGLPRPDKGIAVVLLGNSANFEHAAIEILKICIGDTYSLLRRLSYYDGGK